MPHSRILPHKRHLPRNRILPRKRHLPRKRQSPLRRLRSRAHHSRNPPEFVIQVSTFIIDFNYD